MRKKLIVAVAAIVMLLVGSGTAQAATHVKNTYWGTGVAWPKGVETYVYVHARVYSDGHREAYGWKLVSDARNASCKNGPFNTTPVTREKVTLRIYTGKYSPTGHTFTDSIRCRSGYRESHWHNIDASVGKTYGVTYRRADLQAWEEKIGVDAYSGMLHFTW